MDSQRATGGRAPSPPRRQRACVPCSRAKARCNFRPENIKTHVCDRCEKLGIDCAEKTTKSLRKPRQIKPLNRKAKHIKSSRVSSLEQQLQQLTNTLSDGSPQQGAGSVSSAHSGHQSSPPSIETPSSSRQSSLCTSAQQQQQQHVFAVPSQPKQPPAAPPNGLTWREASSILSIFRRKYMFRFPCVLIENATTPQELLAEKPFLFRAVMLAAGPLPVARAKKMKRNVMAYLSHRLLVEEQRQLDLLQGLLVLIAWNDLDYYRDSQITVLTYTALGLAYSLRLAQAPLGVLRQLGKDVQDDTYVQSNYERGGHTSEEQRAFIGLYCIMSSNSIGFGRRNPLDTQYIAVCCDNLARNRETPYDHFLERMARINLVADKITRAFGSPHDGERSQPWLFLVEGHARTIRAELTIIMESLDFESFQVHPHGQHEYFTAAEEEQSIRRQFFTGQYHCLLVRLYEPATCLRDVPDGQASTFQVACLRNCLFAAKAFLDIMQQIPPAGYIYYHTMGREPFSFVLAVATRLLFLEAPDWDPEFARITLDLPNVMDNIIKLLVDAEHLRRQHSVRFARNVSGIENALSEAAMAEPGGGSEGASMLCVATENMRYLRAWLEEKMAEGETASRLQDEIVGTFEDWDASVAGMCSGVPGTSFGSGATAGAGAAAAATGPAQAPVTVGMEPTVDPGAAVFGGLYGGNPWDFDGVGM